MTISSEAELKQAMVDALVLGQRKQVAVGISRRSYIMSRMDSRSTQIFDALQMIYPVDFLAALALGRRGWNGRRGVDGSCLLPQVLRGAVARMDRPLRIFHFGDRPGVGLKALQQLESKFPGVEAAGSRAVLDELWGPENHQALHKICKEKPDILLVALPSPLLEEWIHAHTSVLDVGIVWGIGRGISY